MVQILSVSKQFAFSLSSRTAIQASPCWPIAAWSKGRGAASWLIVACDTLKLRATSACALPLLSLSNSIVTRLDRLARSTRDLLNVLDTVGKAGAAFKSLGDAWADTTTPHGRLMLTVLGGLAEFERELIIARTGEGRTRAKDRGVKFGRPTALTPHQRQEAIRRLSNGEAQADVARSFNVSQATISRLAAPSPFEASVVAAA